MELISELGGFAENPKDIDGTLEDFNAFNFCLAEEYVDAMYREDFASLGEVSMSLLQTICKWYTYEEINNQDIAQQVKSGNLITIKQRTFIDAIYENKSASLAETYLLMGVYSPKLVLTIVLSDEEEYRAYLICNSQEEFTEKIKQLYEFIEIEYNRCNHKKAFLNKIKNNHSRIMYRNDYITTRLPNTYSWTKDLRKMLKNN